MDPAAPSSSAPNLPWLRYGGDFGANRWAMSGGLSQRGDAEATIDRLHLLRRSGVTVLRWFTLCDGRAGVHGRARRHARRARRLLLPRFRHRARLGEPRRPDAAAGAARFPLVPPAARRSGVQMGGRRRVLASAPAREALVDRVLAPMFARYGREPLIHAWDLINEPEWATFGLGTWNPLVGVPPSAMRGYVRLAAERAHALAQQPVTVGSASTRWLDLVIGLGLDFYQPHWYDKFEARNPLATPVTRACLRSAGRPGRVPHQRLGPSARAPARDGAAGRLSRGIVLVGVRRDTATDFACAQTGWPHGTAATTDRGELRRP